MTKKISKLYPWGIFFFALLVLIFTGLLTDMVKRKWVRGHHNCYKMESRYISPWEWKTLFVCRAFGDQLNNIIQFIHLVATPVWGHHWKFSAVNLFCFVTVQRTNNRSDWLIIEVQNSVFSVFFCGLLFVISVVIVVLTFVWLLYEHIFF